MLGQQRYLFAHIPKSAHGEHRIIFAHVRIKEDWIAPVVNDRAPVGTAVAVANRLHHPRGRCYEGTGFGQALGDYSSIPAQPRTLFWFVSVHGLPPANQVSVGNHHAGHSNR